MTQPAGVVVRRYLDRQREAMLQAALAVRRGEPDAIHDMRIATRRLSSVIGTCSNVLDENRTGDLEVRLRRLAVQLGLVRDPEVLLTRLETELDAQPSGLILGRARSRLQATLRTQTKQAREALLDTMDGPDYARLVADLADFVSSPVAPGRAGRPARKVLPKLVGRSYRKLERRAKQAQRAAQGSARDQALHRTRKAAKRLSYTVEAALAQCGRKGPALAELALQIQVILGEQHDSVVAADFLRALVIGDRSRDKSAFTLGLLVGVEQGRARSAASAFEELWEPRSRPSRLSAAGLPKR